MEYTFHYDSPLGRMTLASDGERLTGLWFDGQKHFAATLDKEHKEKPLPVFAETGRWLDLYFGGTAPDFTPPLSMKTTPFRRAVWAILLTIPYGRSMTYGEIAESIARQKGLARMSARAVGGAVGHNAISLIIPCHRVLGADGSLTGYAGGMERKSKLLALEKQGCPPPPPVVQFRRQIRSIDKEEALWNSKNCCPRAEASGVMRPRPGTTTS